MVAGSGFLVILGGMLRIATVCCAMTCSNDNVVIHDHLLNGTLWVLIEQALLKAALSSTILLPVVPKIKILFSLFGNDVKGFIRQFGILNETAHYERLKVVVDMSQAFRKSSENSYSWAAAIAEYGKVFMHSILFQDMLKKEKKLCNYSIQIGPVSAYSEFGFTEAWSELQKEYKVCANMCSLSLKLPASVFYHNNMLLMIITRQRVFRYVLLLFANAFCTTPNHLSRLEHLFLESDLKFRQLNFYALSKFCLLHRFEGIPIIAVRDSACLYNISIHWEYKMQEISGSFDLAQWPLDFVLLSKIKPEAQLQCISRVNTFRAQLQSCGSLSEKSALPIGIMSEDPAINRCLADYCSYLKFGVSNQYSFRAILPSLSVWFRKYLKIEHSMIPNIQGSFKTSTVVKRSDTNFNDSYLTSNGTYSRLPGYLISIIERYLKPSMEETDYVAVLCFVLSLNDSVYYYVVDLLNHLLKVTTLLPKICSPTVLHYNDTGYKLRILKNINVLISRCVKSNWGVKVQLFVQSLNTSIHRTIELMICLGSESLIFSIPEYDSDADFSILRHFERMAYYALALKSGARPLKDGLVKYRLEFTRQLRLANDWWLLEEEEMYRLSAFANNIHGV